MDTSGLEYLQAADNRTQPQPNKKQHFLWEQCHPAAPANQGDGWEGTSQIPRVYLFLRKRRTQSSRYSSLPIKDQKYLRAMLLEREAEPPQGLNLFHGQSRRNRDQTARHHRPHNVHQQRHPSSLKPDHNNKKTLPNVCSLKLRWFVSKGKERSEPDHQVKYR